MSRPSTTACRAARSRPAASTTRYRPNRSRRSWGASELNKILRLLQDSTGVDFTLYKSTTLYRRVTRRMLLHQLAGLPEYLRMLRSDAAEVRALYQDILISVTAFFRDQPCFERIKSGVLPRLLADRPTPSSGSPSIIRRRRRYGGSRPSTWLWYFKEDRQILDESLHALMGLRPGMVHGLSDFLAAIHPDDQAAVQAAFFRAVHERVELDVEFRAVRPDGEVRWLRDRGKIILAENATECLTGATPTRPAWRRWSATC